MYAPKMPGFFGGIGPGGQGNVPRRAGKYDQFGRPVGPQALLPDPQMGGLNNQGNESVARPGRYDQFGRPLAPHQMQQETNPIRALLPSPGVVFPRTLRASQPMPPGLSRVTSAPVGPSKEAMIEHACRPIMKVDKASAHYPWSVKDDGETSPLMPPPPLPDFDFRPSNQSGRESDRDQDRRNRNAMRMDRPGLGFGEEYEREARDRDMDTGSRSDPFGMGQRRDSSPDRSRSSDRDSDRKGRVDVRFEGRGLRDLYQDNDFGKRPDQSSDRKSDSRDSGRRRQDDDRGRSDRGGRGRDRDRDRDRSPRKSSRDKDRSSDRQPRDSDDARKNERMAQQQSRQAQRSNNVQELEQGDDFNTAWQKASKLAQNPGLFGSASTLSSSGKAWWSSCTICKTNFMYKEEFTSHVEEPLHYINLEKVRKEHAKEKAVKKVANLSQVANAVETIAYRCKICNITLNGWANFNQHVSSQIHLVHFIKNVGPKGDPKGLEYFEVSDMYAPGAVGKGPNDPASLLSDWRRCKSCNLNIPSWEESHVCSGQDKTDSGGDDAVEQAMKDSLERTPLPEEIAAKKKALVPAIFLFIRESLTRSNFPGLSREVPAMVPSEVSTIAAELIGGAARYPTLDPGVLIVGAVVSGIKLYITRKRRKGWRCWARDVHNVQERLKALVEVCGGRTADLDEKFSMMFELTEPEEPVQVGFDSNETLASGTDLQDKNDSQSDQPPTLLKELKTKLTKLVYNHVRSIFNNVPCIVPKKLPKTIWTAAVNLDAHVQHTKSGEKPKSSSAVTAAVLNGLKLKDNHEQDLRDKLNPKYIDEMLATVVQLVSKYGGSKHDLVPSFERIRRVALNLYVPRRHEEDTSDKEDQSATQLHKEVTSDRENRSSSRHHKETASGRERRSSSQHHKETTSNRESQSSSRHHKEITSDRESRSSSHHHKETKSDRQSRSSSQQHKETTSDQKSSKESTSDRENRSSSQHHKESTSDRENQSVSQKHKEITLDQSVSGQEEVKSDRDMVLSILGQQDAEDTKPDNLQTFKDRLANSVANYIWVIMADIPITLPLTVPPGVFSDAENLFQRYSSQYRNIRDATPGDIITYAVRDGMKKVSKSTLPAKFTSRHVRELQESFYALVQHFTGRADILEFRFEELLELTNKVAAEEAARKEKMFDLSFPTSTSSYRDQTSDNKDYKSADTSKSSSNSDDKKEIKPVQMRLKPMSKDDRTHKLTDDKSALKRSILKDSVMEVEKTSEEKDNGLYAQVKMSVTRAVRAYVRDTLKSSSEEIPARAPVYVWTPAHTLQRVALRNGISHGFAITSAVQDALTDDIVLDIKEEITPESIQALYFCLGALVKEFRGKPEALSSRFESLLTLAGGKAMSTRFQNLLALVRGETTAVATATTSSQSQGGGAAGTNLVTINVVADTSATIQSGGNLTEKEPAVLPNNVFKKKMALRIRLFGYIKDYLKEQQNMEQTLVVPDNVYTQVEDLVLSATIAKLNPAPIVTGGVVAAVCFVNKRIYNATDWKFTEAAVLDLKGRLENLVRSFGGDPSELTPSLNILKRFAKDYGGKKPDSLQVVVEANSTANQPSAVGSEQSEEQKTANVISSIEVNLPLAKRKSEVVWEFRKYCEKLLVQKQVIDFVKDAPFGVIMTLQKLTDGLMLFAQEYAQGCDRGELITSAAMEGVQMFSDEKKRKGNPWKYSSAEVYDLVARVENFIVEFGGDPLKLEEVFKEIMERSEDKDVDVSVIGGYSFDDIVQLEELLGISEESMVENTAKGGDGFSLFSGPAPDATEDSGWLEEHMPDELRAAKETLSNNLQELILTAIQTATSKEIMFPDAEAKAIVSCCQNVGWESAKVITDAVSAALKMVMKSYKKRVQEYKSMRSLKYISTGLKWWLQKLNGAHVPKSLAQDLNKLSKIGHSLAKERWYIRKISRLQVIASHPGFERLKTKAEERYKLHLRTQQHLDSTVSDVLREVIEEETSFIKKKAQNGKEKNVEDIERNRKAFWETQMPLNHSRPSQGQMDDAYSNFLKEAGIDSDNRQGETVSKPQISPQFRGQKGSSQQQKQDHGRLDAGSWDEGYDDFDYEYRRRQEESRRSDPVGGFDYGGSSGKQAVSSRYDQGKRTASHSAPSASGSLSSQGQSVMNLFGKFLEQTGGKSLPSGQAQGAGQQGNQASKLLDTIQNKLENIGEVEDDSAINMILDRVLNEYKALKTGGSQPIKETPSTFMGAGMPGNIQPAAQQLQMQHLQGMQMQQMQMQGQMNTAMLMQQTPASLMQQPVPTLMSMQPNKAQSNESERNQQNRNQQGRNQQGQVQGRTQQGQVQGRTHQSQGQNQQGQDKQPGKMKALLAASLAASLASNEKKKKMSDTTQTKLMAVVRSLNERLDPNQGRKRQSRWNTDDSKSQADRHVSPERKRLKDRSPDQGRGNSQGDRRGGRDGQDNKMGGKRQDAGNHQGTPLDPLRMNKDEWINEMKKLQEQSRGGGQMMPGGGGQVGGPMMPGAGGPVGGQMMPGAGGQQGAAPIKSLLPPPGEMNKMQSMVRMLGPGAAMQEKQGMKVPIEKITALYGDIMNVLAPGSVNSPQEMSVATEMIASLSQAMVCVLNNIYSPESQVKIQQSAQKFKLAFGNHPLVQAFFAATSVPPDSIQFLARLEPMLLKRVVVVLQQARKDIQQQALQSAVFLEKFMVNSKLR